LGRLARQPEAALADGGGHGAIDKPWEPVAHNACAHAIHFSPALFVARLAQVLGYVGLTQLVARRWVFYAQQASSTGARLAAAKRQGQRAGPSAAVEFTLQQTISLDKH
jgi:hypothetical protein